MEPAPHPEHGSSAASEPVPAAATAAEPSEDSPAGFGAPWAADAAGEAADSGGDENEGDEEEEDGAASSSSSSSSAAGHEQSLASLTARIADGERALAALQTQGPDLGSEEEQRRRRKEAKKLEKKLKKWAKKAKKLAKKVKKEQQHSAGVDFGAEAGEAEATAAQDGNDLDHRKRRRKEKKKSKSKLVGGSHNETDGVGDFIVHEGEEGEDDGEDVKVEGGIHSSQDEWSEDDAGRGSPGSHRGMSQLDKNLEALRLKRKRRRRKMTDGECQAHCNLVLEQMTDAAKRDEEALKVSQPAVCRLQLLESICGELVKPKWRQWFVAEGCCQAIASWLAPLGAKDYGLLPNATIRSRLLLTLQQLPIAPHDLQNNDLGKVLVLLWQHPEETEENRVIIRSLIQKWMRPMLGVGASYKEYQKERDYHAVTATHNAADAALLQRTSSAVAEKWRTRARVPQNPGFNFVVQPKSSMTAEEAKLRYQEVQSRKSGITRRLQPRASKPGKTQTVSIEGRGLNM
eukprot:GHVT01087328.1.p1 GENE.GHVT01087328.1~~GHVT01087328.1.p1  ORF type:complete len:516 (+),score=158.85 GHVT01087328.1:339-1886(+)